MLTFRLIYQTKEGNQQYIITADSKQSFDNQFQNFLKFHDIDESQVTIECISSII